MFLFPMPPKIAQMALGKEGNNSMFNPILGGLFRGSFLKWGREDRIIPLSKTRQK